MEQTIFFVKHRHLEFADDIYSYLISKIPATPGFPLVNSRGLVRISEEGWRKFYENLADEFPGVLSKMARDFAQHLVDLSIIVGDDVVRQVKELAGPTRYEDNPDFTIRRKWGPYELPHTVVHASSKGDFERERKVLREYLIEDGR